MELPDEIVAHIREFSLPITRPDWLSFRPMSAHILHTEITENYNNKFVSVIDTFVQNYDYSTYIYHFRYEKIVGITKCKPIYATQLHAF